MKKFNIEKLNEVHDNPQESAELIGLKYINDDIPGINRIRKGKVFTYDDLNGKTPKKTDIERIKKLRIPPAWQEVWISPFRNSHIQATGIDKKGQKQYIYHKKWQEFRGLINFYRLLILGEALPTIREKINQYINQKELTREKVLSAVIKIIESTYIRIGNDQYAEENESYGITTLRKKHIEIKKVRNRGDNTKEPKVILEFKGKSGKEHTINIEDQKIAHIIDELVDIPGFEIFKYYDEEGNVHDVKSTDVNAFIQELSNEHLTAKDFRTWGGTKLCFKFLKEHGDFKTKKERSKNIIESIDMVAENLGNTRAVAKSSYIHPHILNCYENRTFFKHLKEVEAEDIKYSGKLTKDETILLGFLQKIFAEKVEEIMGS